jgi:hypothetical protein
MPACKITVRTMMGKEAESEIDNVSASVNTISMCVDDVSHDIEDVFSEILENTNFALLVDDESTDIINKAQLLAFVRFEHEGEIKGSFCCCKDLSETTNGRDIFNVLSSYLESGVLPWKQYVGIRSDSAPSVIGSVQGFVALFKKGKRCHCDPLLPSSRSSCFKNYWGRFNTSP